MIEHKAHCAVCGRKPGTDVSTYEHHKVLHKFCSMQCRENFQAHPILYIGIGRHQGDIIKRRKLGLAQELDAADAAALSSFLHETIGIKQVNVNPNRIVLQYDLLLLTLAQLEHLLGERGIALDNVWWQRLRRGWWQNTEANELDNLAMPEAACCSRPPPGAM